jgi:hypothetical protein
MGMAPFESPCYVDKVHQLLRLGGDGSFELNMEYFSFHYSADQTFISLSGMDVLVLGDHVIEKTDAPFIYSLF